MKTIEISMDAYIEALELRKDYIEKFYNWVIPDCIWDYAKEIIKKTGINSEHSEPSYVVDNIAINGDYGSFDDYKEKNESDKDFIDRIKNEAIAIFEEERYILMSL